MESFLTASLSSIIAPSTELRFVGIGGTLIFHLIKAIYSPVLSKYKFLIFLKSSQAYFFKFSLRKRAAGW